MEIKKNKELYDVPTVHIVDIKIEGVICDSLTDLEDYPNGGDPFNS